MKEADAIATEKEGLAKVAVERAEVSVIEERGTADAKATAKMRAEAVGIAEKASSMAQLTDATKDHEEFRLRLQNELEIAKEQIGAQIKVTKENAGLWLPPLRMPSSISSVATAPSSIALSMPLALVNPSTARLVVASTSAAWPMNTAMAIAA